MGKLPEDVGQLDDIPVQGAQQLCFGYDGRPIADFRTLEDGVFASVDECPHRQGPLSEGIICGDTVTCPLHNWAIGLKEGTALAPDEAKPFLCQYASSQVKFSRPAMHRRECCMTVRTTVPIVGLDVASPSSMACSPAIKPIRQTSGGSVQREPRSRMRLRCVIASPHR